MADWLVERLKRIIADELDVNLGTAEIDECAPLFETGIGLDSTAVMELILLVEEHFGFEFSEEELSVEVFESLKSLAAFIGTKGTTGKPR